VKNTFAKNLKIGIAQINPHAGNIEKNIQNFLKNIERAQEKNVDLLFFPKGSLLGYKMDDTIAKFPFLLTESKNTLCKIQEGLDKEIILTMVKDNSAKDTLCVIQDGMHKNKYFENGFQHILLNGKKIVCCMSKISEINLKDVKVLKPDILVFFDNIAILPNELYSKTEMIKSFAKELKIPVINVSATGGTDSYILAGGSCVINSEGNIISLAKQYQEDFLVLNPFEKTNKTFEIKEIKQKEKFSLDYEDDLERTYNVLVYGIKEYFTKCGIQRAVLGLSGGLDSTICAVLIADALGKENVLGVSMPSKLTSKESLSDAKILAQNLGINFTEMPIKPMFETTKDCLDALFTDIEKLWDNRYKTSYTSDNIQARSRAMYLWGISNEFSSCIPIATSDKSEAYMGYATINGDMSGGFAPILDITKTKLFALARWMNKNRPEKNVIPQSVIDKKPGAELAINPKTGKTLNAEDALMPYEFMDEVIWRIEKKHETFNQMMASVFEYEQKYQLTKEQKQEWLEKFYKRMERALYKAYIMPPSIITVYPSNIKTAYYQPITSFINYKN